MALILTRLRGATLLLLAVVLLGTLGIRVIGNGRWSWFQSFFHTLITLSTVGYGELPGMEHDLVARGFSLVLVITGAGSVVYFASIVTALFVEGELHDHFRKARMRKLIDEMQGHIIVCGAGRTGLNVIEELTACGSAFVAVDADAARLERLRHDFPNLRYVVGDATEDDVLREAGITRAQGLVAALTDDQPNLYVTLTARSLNPALRIIAKAVEHSAVPKLTRAGADRVVSTHRIGGLRLASEMIRPHATEFLDMMLRAPQHVLRIEEVSVAANSPLCGRALGEANIVSLANVLVVALRTPEGAYRFNPAPEITLDAGCVLIVLSDQAQAAQLRAALGSVPPSTTVRPR